MIAGIATGPIWAQAPGRGGQAGPPSVSKRGNRQIGSPALNVLGLRVGFSVGAFGPVSFSEAAEKADGLGTAFLEASSSQKVSPEISKSLDYNLSPDEVTKIKYRLAELRLRLFAFAKAVDTEMIVTSAAPAAVPELDRLAGEFGANAAFEGSNPNTLMSSLEGLSSRMGLSADTAGWASLTPPREQSRLCSNGPG